MKNLSSRTDHGSADPGLVELVGLFLTVVGAGAMVGAAALVSAPLAVLAAGVFVILAGLVAVYVAVQLERQAAARPLPAADAGPSRPRPPVVG